MDGPRSQKDTPANHAHTGDIQLLERDSLQPVYAKRALLDDMAFADLMELLSRHSTNARHVFLGVTRIKGRQLP